MSLTLLEAQERVNRRIAPLSTETRPAEDFAVLCAGSGVPGPELVREIQLDAVETLSHIADGGDPAHVIAGMLIRTFWLGYEFGAAPE